MPKAPHRDFAAISKLYGGVGFAENTGGLHPSVHVGLGECNWSGVNPKTNIQSSRDGGWCLRTGGGRHEKCFWSGPQRWLVHMAPVAPAGFVRASSCAL